MKTFNEAFETVTTSKLVVTDGIKSFGPEQFENEKFLNFIEQLTMKHLEQILEISVSSKKSDDKTQVLYTSTCGMLQSIFCAGILVGIEMEKS